MRLLINISGMTDVSGCNILTFQDTCLVLVLCCVLVRLLKLLFLWISGDESEGDKP